MGSGTSNAPGSGAPLPRPTPEELEDLFRTEHQLSTGCAVGPRANYWGKCSCGWSARLSRATRVEALADAEDHWRRTRL